MTHARFILALLLTLCHQSLSAPRNTSLSISHYSIKARLVPTEHSLIAEATIVLRNGGNASASTIRLSLVHDTLYSIQDAAGNDIPFTSQGNILQLKKNIAPSETLVVHLRYTGEFFGNVACRIDTTNAWLLSESVWYPRLDDNEFLPNRFTYDLAITVPSGWTALSSGKLVDSSKSNAESSYRWTMTRPTSFISIAAAPYRTKKYPSDSLTIFSYSNPDDRQLDSLAFVVRSVLQYYRERFGKETQSEFKIVETARRGGYGAPGLILLNSNLLPVPDGHEARFINVFLIAHELAHQWWANEVAITDAPFLNEALAQYAAFNFIEHAGLSDVRQSIRLVRIPALGIDIRADYDLYEGVHAANQRPFDDVALADVGPGDPDYRRLAYYKGFTVLTALAAVIGDSVMQLGLAHFVDLHRGQNVTAEDLRQSLESTTRRDLKDFFADWIGTTKRFDYSVADLDSRLQRDGRFQTTVVVKNRGEIEWPVQLRLATIGGTYINRPIDSLKQGCLEFRLTTDQEIVSAVIDPQWRVLDADRSNNVWPRTHRFNFLVAAFYPTSIQYFFGPSITYGMTDGIRAGLWLTNAIPVNMYKRVRHDFEWRLALFYGIKSQTPGYSANFTSIIGMPSSRWSYGALAEDVRGLQTFELNGSYRWNQEHTLRFSLQRAWLHDGSYFDPLDYEAGRTTSLAGEYRINLSGYSVTATANTGVRALSGNHDFVKAAFEVSGTDPFAGLVSFRFFAGAARGSYQSQDAFFLSGSVKPSSVAYWFLDPDAKISTQERLHTTGDANLRGYVGSHRRGSKGVGLNTEVALPTLRILRFFFDAGNVWESSPTQLLWNAGLGIDLTILRLDFPFFVSHPSNGESQFGWRWLLEVKI